MRILSAGLAVKNVRARIPNGNSRSRSPIEQDWAQILGWHSITESADIILSITPVCTRLSSSSAYYCWPPDRPTQFQPFTYTPGSPARAQARRATLKVSLLPSAERISFACLNACLFVAKVSHRPTACCFFIWYLKFLRQTAFCLTTLRLSRQFAQTDYSSLSNVGKLSSWI